MNKQEYIYKVSFKEEAHGDAQCWVRDNFFTSLSAIYEVFTPEQIGCSVNRLWNVKITPDKPYKGRNCTISKEPLMRKSQKKPI